jgi:urease accessory protein
MTNSVEFLTALQHADSFFPGGAVAFSWGLETLASDEIVGSAATLEAFIRGQLIHRWSCFDRAFLVAAMGKQQDEIYLLDREIECLTLVREQRDGSKRAGRSLLTIHDRLGTAGCRSYLNAVKRSEVYGHLPVVQGFLFDRLGISLEIAQAMSAYGLVISGASAAVRLSLVGALDAQRIISALRSDIARILTTLPPRVENAFSYVPQCEVAVMRHEMQASRLFAN